MSVTPSTGTHNTNNVMNPNTPKITQHHAPNDLTAATFTGSSVYDDDESKFILYSAFKQLTRDILAARAYC